ncbi:MAG TPA: PPC domain-containing protein [Candidatus Krumholzibacteria bacterium]|nr:PPC domain-containing protein [Candidatus Krumholzibacteria bacterium]HPD70539.1 PPC domain-containing protein [Candidatus Krumholzibacteria bacterium]HRY39761.1 PPC domain-containing protein [Candidatus Krumholzibacteria bacterium]
MKKATALILALLVCAAFASAAEKPEAEHGPTVILPIAVEGSRAVGDDCTDPIVIGSLPFSDLNQTNCGRGNTYAETCLGSYDGGEDIIYRLDLAVETTVEITMDPLGTTWTGIALDEVCPPDATCIAVVTGSAATPRTILETLAAGSYYIMVDTWPSPACIPAFNLTVEEAVPYPNPTCETAIDIQEQGLTTWEVDNCGSGADYSPTNGCTGYAANGQDAVWKIYLLAGDTFTVTLTNESYDASLYLLTDCADMNSCVAGGDDPEEFTYIAAADGWYYLIVDGYATGACGTSTITVETPVATKTATWATVKDLFR